MIAEPFAGREILLEYADEAFGAASQRVGFDGVVTDPSEVSLPNAEVAVVEGCHYLYTRRIGGYDVLDDVLGSVVERDGMVVTAWNAYAWDYLAAIRDVEHVFPVQIRVPSLDAAAIRELVAEHYGPDLPEFVQTDAHGRVKSVELGRRPVSIAGRRVEVPTPELNLEYLTSRSEADRYGDVEAVVFEMLANCSDGNPGVARALWERSVRDGEVAPSYVEEVEGGLDVNHDQAFLLELVLAKGTVDVATLEDVLVNVPVERSLGALVHQGVLEVTDGTVSLVPERLRTTVEHLRGRQLLW